MIRGGKDKSCNSEKAEEKRLGWVDVQREGSLPEEEKRKRRNACIVCTGWIESTREEHGFMECASLKMVVILMKLKNEQLCLGKKYCI